MPLSRYGFPPRTSLVLPDSVKPEHALQALREDVQKHRTILRLTGTLVGTKTAPAPSDILVYRDFHLELLARGHLDLVGQWRSLHDRYVDFDATRAQATNTAPTEVTSASYPKHCAVRLVAGVGGLASGRNIFLFMPYAVGVVSTDPADHFSLELVDVGNAIMVQIVWPAVSRLFVPSSQLAILGDTPPGLPTERAIYSQSLLHEQGHRFGPWRVIPQQAPGMALGREFGTFEFDVMGELATDGLAATLVPQLPDLMRVTALQRIFAFGRRGFAANPWSAEINDDNDCWIGSCLWKRFVHAGALRRTAEGWNWNEAAARNACRELCLEVDSLGRQILHLPSEEQLARVRAWMRRQVPQDRNGRYVLPAALRDAYLAMRDLPEHPQIHPPASLPLTVRQGP